MKTRNYFLYIVICNILYSCNDNPTHTKTVLEYEDVTTHFPFESDVNQLSILRNGSYHGDEISTDIRMKKWMELIKIGNTYALVNSSLRLNRVHDEILDEDYEMSGWEVKTPHENNSVLLIEKYPFLKENEVKHIATNVHIDFGQEQSYSYQDIKYRLFATGDKASDKNYRLYVEAEKNGEKRITLLVAIPQYDDKQTLIHFIGDIDNDGRLDFIIDCSSHYNAETLTLYLSQPTDAESLCVPVGQITSVGC